MFDIEDECGIEWDEGQSRSVLTSLKWHRPINDPIEFLQILVGGHPIAEKSHVIGEQFENR